MIRTIHIVLLSLLSAGILTFYAPHPARAQPATTATGQYIDCGKVAADVSLMVRAIEIAPNFAITAAASSNSDWYTKVVAAHALRALKTSNPAQYVRDLHKACRLETA